jgi:hypothetical protein
MPTNITNTDFCYSQEELKDLEAFLDGLAVTYEVFVEDEEESLYKAVICNAEPGILHKIYEWELDYFE